MLPWWLPATDWTQCGVPSGPCLPAVGSSSGSLLLGALHQLGKTFCGLHWDLILFPTNPFLLSFCRSHICKEVWGSPYPLLLPSCYPHPSKSFACLTHLSICFLEDLNWHRWWNWLRVKSAEADSMMGLRTGSLTFWLAQRALSWVECGRHDIVSGKMWEPNWWRFPHW